MDSSRLNHRTKLGRSMQLPIEFQTRLDILVLQVSRALGSNTTREEVLFVVIGLGLTSAEERRDLARRMRDRHVPPRHARVARRRTARPNALSDGERRRGRSSP
jgi:hypothetical protein